MVATIAAFTLAIRARLLRRAQVAAQAENLALQTELDRLRKSQTFSGVGTWDWLVDTDTLHWSDEIYPMFGFAPGEVVPTYSLFCSMVHPDDARRVREGEIACTAGTRLYDQRYRVVWRDGTVRWLSETGDIIVDDDGLPVRMIGTVRDVTEEKAREQRMQHLAFHDELTGLHNRAYFNIRMEDALARARRQSGLMALAFIDLDRFKPINDLHGHAAGDAVLVALAQRLQQTVRATDCVARLGGDEFVVVLEHLSTPDEATALASKLLNAVRAPFALDGLTLNLDASVGIALYPVHADNAVSLIEQADRAMYAAKAAGAGFVVAAPEATPVA
ncbi:MAG TPA: diguanylate cyclase [Magnetospirillum sp.]|nr:diguanylate cyclase [Magnetospirillum sp.]